MITFKDITNEDLLATHKEIEAYLKFLDTEITNNLEENVAKEEPSEKADETVEETPVEETEKQDEEDSNEE